MSKLCPATGLLLVHRVALSLTSWHHLLSGALLCENGQQHVKVNYVDDGFHRILLLPAEGTEPETASMSSVGTHAAQCWQ
ncbi:hypothetical protein M440DRAFT_1400317 [Trichoderma longibrachiatum ATCC 18648]|uniref:Secreted protein n=1 Tax=Trichoderma longibrachiatum ATCC 18648 TaxID=983965 RepID=A0A2T4C761_TRILO|nr:hypothetical protein M440DRAFT_1400317 [Trichoderma longibrachiatum ATCC 18648]